MAGTTRLRLRVSPGAARAEVVGRHGDGWKVRVPAPPERGRANDAVLALLADTLGVERGDVTLVSGRGSRDKIVEVGGLAADEAERRMAGRGQSAVRGRRERFPKEKRTKLLTGGKRERFPTEGSPMNTDRFRTALLEERGRVASALKYLNDETDGAERDEASNELSTADNHLGDRASETFDRELDYTLEENAEVVIADIDRALARIEAGTYGTCERCGKQIPEERLEARPWANLCIEDQEKEDRGA